MLRWILAATFAVLASLPAAAQQTLATVKQRGTLNCGVSQGFPGFSAPDSRGEFRGLDVD
jgi:general L-amino acid transport system substrate-binding protein